MATKKNKKESSQMGTVEKSSNNDASVTDDIRGAEYYHGMVPRQDAEGFLKREGDFLVRKTEQTPGKVVLALSVRVNDELCRHFMLNMDPATNKFYFEFTHQESTIPDLINWHMTTKTPISAASGAKIRRPMERSPWLINHDSIVANKKLGEGAFGDVFIAELDQGGKQEVAVKTMRAEATREARLRFMKEARLMRKYQHKHVVKLIGVAIHEHPLMIVMEYCPNGSLLSHLKKNKVSAADKLRFTTEAADGIAYLERSKCIHRDIAARNCLLSAKNELKISDFGMSDNKDEIKDEALEKVPVKWLAPETLQEKVFTHKTDIWTFGVLVWEIYADGAEPYPGLTKIQTRAKLVVSDYRMKMPDGTPATVSEIVTGTCWQKNPEKRSTMDAIHKKLREFYEKK
ncbi:hypothetical protein L5515_001807 [Caenorhabditis briggsae]|uniref:Tyrosine-protein kinase n=3 Tax=Caenorhabditis TaxID=6237 RepID=A0AAE9E6X0_CAEBR|nr:hypothetical protein B9Z55_002395 [Caenorhabditis nigoni]UMM13638.1 hypothetical protein L5515_001807 [Caenorhabditis briggsae]